MHPDFAHIGDTSTNLIEECAELIQAITKLQRFGDGLPDYDNRAQVHAEIADVRRRINEWERSMTKCFDYMECSNPARCGAEGVCRIHEAEQRATPPAPASPAEPSEREQSAYLRAILEAQGYSHTAITAMGSDTFMMTLSTINAARARGAPAPVAGTRETQS